MGQSGSKLPVTSFRDRTLSAQDQISGRRCKGQGRRMAVLLWFPDRAVIYGHVEPAKDTHCRTLEFRCVQLRFVQVRWS